MKGYSCESLGQKSPGCNRKFDRSCLIGPSMLLIELPAPFVRMNTIVSGFARPAWTDLETCGSDLSGWDDDAIETTLEFTLRTLF